jgi:O-succinylbenzoate synthase
MRDTDRPQQRSNLRIDGATLRLVRLPLVTPFTIATGTLTEKVFPLLTLRADGIEGHAEGVMDPLPDYLEETVAGAMDFLSTVLLPQVVGHSFANPESLARRLAPWRANHMAKATVEMAFWDLWAKSLGLPLQTVLGGEGDAIDVGVSLGIGPVTQTLERVGRIWRRATSASS